MPNPHFNELFLKAVPESRNMDLDLTFLYKNIVPIYFDPVSDNQETVHQLEKFKKNNLFPEFRHQYEVLLEALNKWCQDHSILVKLTDEYKPTLSSKPAFTLYLERMFGDYDFYSLRKALLFNEGKKLLEEILFLLADDSVLLPLKLKTLTNLQNNIEMCADGAYDNIIDAKDDLKAARQGINFLKMNTLRTLIQQHAIYYLNVHPFDEGNEIHYVNAFTNYVAADYGIPLKEDNFIKSLKIPYWRFHRFSQTLDQSLTPEIVVKSLMHSLTSELSLIRQQFIAAFFKKKSAIPLDESYAARKEGDRLITSWNKKYDQILPLDLTFLFQFDENESSVITTPYNEALLRKILSTHFNQLFLKNNPNYYSILLDDKCRLIIDQGLNWLEKKSEIGIEITDFNPHEFNFTRELTDIKEFNALIESFPEYALKLKNSLFSRRLQQLSIIESVQNGYFSTIMLLITSDSITSEQKEELQTSDFAALMKLYFSSEQCFKLIEKLLNINLLHPDVLLLAWQPTMCYQGEKRFLFLRKLLDKNLLTRELLAKTETIHPFWLGSFGINTIWCLIEHEQFILLQKLIDKNLLTTKMLEAAPEIGNDAGKNSLWKIIYSKKIKLFNTLLSANLLTSDLLALRLPKESDYAGTNIIWMLASQKHFDVIEQLIVNDFLTTNIIESAPEKGLKAGKNVLWMLIHYQKIKLIDILLKKNILTTNILIAAPNEGSFAGKNNLWLLIIQNKIKLIEKLVTKRLLTSELLATTITKGTNIIWMLASHHHYKMIEVLFNNALLTQAILAETPGEGINTDSNVVSQMITHRKFKLLGKLIDADLLSPEALKNPDFVNKLTAKHLTDATQRFTLFKTLSLTEQKIPENLHNPNQNP